MPENSIIAKKHISELELPKLANEYLNYMRVTLNRSERTLEQYAIDLYLFFRYMKGKSMGLDDSELEAAEIDISDIDASFLEGIEREDVLEYFGYVALERENKSRARARKLSSLKGFFKYANRRGIDPVRNNPVKEIDGPAIERRLPKYLSLDESIELLDAVKEDSDSKSRLRDYAMITLFLNTGMRLSELTGMNITDLDRDLTSARIIGKGDKERIIYLNDACRTALSDYLKVRALDAELKDRNALFISRFHTRISQKTVQHVVYKYLEAAGLKSKGYSVHKLRHTAATLMYQTGKVDVRVLKDILGHEQLNTTQIYTHLSDDSMKQAMAQNPLSGVKLQRDKDKDKKK